jgi:hypothetical protein
MPGPFSSRDLAKARTLLGGGLGPSQGTWRAFLRALDLYAWGSGVLLWRSGLINEYWDVLPFLATWRPWTCPCGGAGRHSQCSLEVRVRRLHAVVEGICHTRFQGVEPSAYHMCARIHFHTYVDVTSVIYQKTMQ